ncbi:uncharacterized protein si:dkey-75a21.2 [Scomber scombrus]|uniref:Uncharacterized protein si:dkey-75a21.2 n=1 Tax=Scomber scombrus TaxID=13677 RepID=A0AAV1NYK8_SCOSC
MPSRHIMQCYRIISPFKDRGKTGTTETAIKLKLSTDEEGKRWLEDIRRLHMTYSDAGRYNKYQYASLTFGITFHISLVDYRKTPITVASSSNAVVSYHVDMPIGCCTRPAGIMDGHCKHQSALARMFGHNDSFLHGLSTDTRKLYNQIAAENDWRGGYGGAREKRWELTEHQDEERERGERKREEERGRKEGRTDARKEGRRGEEEEKEKREKSDRGEEECEEGARLEHRRILR